MGDGITTFSLENNFRKLKKKKWSWPLPCREGI